MKYLLYLKRAAGVFVSWLCFPKTCVICGKSSVYQPLCSSCTDHFTSELRLSFTERRCSQCGRLLLSESSVCTECRKEDALFPAMKITGYERPFPVFPYLGKKKRLLTTWKIAGDRSLSALYANWLNQLLISRYSGIPVVPVPPRKNKIKEKGWDQMEELCRILHVLYKVPVYHLIQRTSLVQQKKLNRQQRLSKTDSEYLPLPGITQVPEEVVLLDDVITTGSTVYHASQALHAAGVKTVHVVALFYVP